MKIRAFLVRYSAVIFSFAAISLLCACGGGFSTPGNLSSNPAPQSSAHTVSLSWTASTSPDVSGYNIYRATYTNACGAFTKINSAVNASTLFTDSTVASGASYCYATTAVNTSNEESAYSNVVSDVQVPSP